MKSKTFKKLLVLAALPLAIPAAMAIQIDGSISFSGSTTLDAPLPGASAFSAFSVATVTAGTQTGDYLGTAGSSVTFMPFTFAPSSAPVDPVWSFSNGGNDYSFRLDSINDVEQGPLGGSLFELSVSGLGVASITGFEDTAGEFSITTTSNGNDTSVGFGAFSFTTPSAPPSNVPDSGATAALLGLSLVGLAAVRRRMTK